jgi:hypothetical protein
MREKRREGVLVTRHWRKTMQRFSVSHVKSICVMSEVKATTKSG